MNCPRHAAEPNLQGGGISAQCLTRSSANMRRLSELAARFEFVRDACEPLREPVPLDRTNTTFHDLYRLARLFPIWRLAEHGRRPRRWIRPCFCP